MAFRRKTGLCGAIFGFLERAFAQHFEQIGAGQCGFLLPEQTTLSIAIALNQKLEAFCRVRIAEAALGGEQQSQFLTQ